MITKKIISSKSFLPEAWVWSVCPTRRGLGNANELGERQLENAERVNLPNGKVDGERCGRKKPTIIARFGYSSFSIKKAHPD